MNNNKINEENTQQEAPKTDMSSREPPSLETAHVPTLRTPNIKAFTTDHRYGGGAWPLRAVQSDKHPGTCWPHVEHRKPPRPLQVVT